MTTQQWRYKTITLTRVNGDMIVLEEDGKPADTSLKSMAFRDVLTNCGNDGWELVTSLPSPYFGILFFKKLA
jgi:hypothetical protein